MVALLWVANIGILYPVVEVIFQDQSMHQWIDGKIKDTDATVTQKSKELDGLRRQLAVAPPGDAKARRTLEWAIANAATDRNRAVRSLQAYRSVKPYIYRYLPESPFQTLLLITGLVVAGTLIKDVFLVANNVLVVRLAQLGTFDLRKLFYRRTLRMDLATFGEDGTANLMSRFTNDMNQVAYGLDSLFGKLIREPLKMVACLAGAAYFSWRLLLLTLIITPLAVVSIRWLGRVLKRANRRAMEEIAVIYATLEETFRSIKIVKAFTNERQERRRFHHDNKRYLHKAIRIASYDSLTHPLTEALGITTVSLAMIAGAWLILSRETHLLGIRMSDGPLGRADMLTFFFMLAGMADPLRKMSDIFSNLQAGFAAADRIFDRLDREPRIRDPKTPAPFVRHHRDLAFENVSFGYQPEKLVLQDLNLTIGFGETIAVVGPNGCGKTTLANLIPRFADPDRGTIKLDGVPLPAMRVRDLRRQIGVVTQETMLFDDTIFNNIRYGSTEATREQVVEAAKQAHAHRFIERDLPDGYETHAARWAAGSPAGNGSASPWRGPSSAIRPSSSSTRPPARSTWRASKPFNRSSKSSLATAPRS